MIFQILYIHHFSNIFLSFLVSDFVVDYAYTPSFCAAIKCRHIVLYSSCAVVSKFCRNIFWRWTSLKLSPNYILCSLLFQAFYRMSNHLVIQNGDYLVWNYFFKIVADPFGSFVQVLEMLTLTWECWHVYWSTTSHRVSSLIQYFIYLFNIMVVCSTKVLCPRNLFSRKLQRYIWHLCFRHWQVLWLLLRKSRYFAMM